MQHEEIKVCIWYLSPSELAIPPLPGKPHGHTVHPAGRTAGSVLWSVWVVLSKRSSVSQENDIARGSFFPLY